MHDAEVWLATLPPLTIYLVAGLVIGLESMGIPLPGEITLVSAALRAWALAAAVPVGAVSTGWLRRRARQLSALEPAG